MGIDVVSGFSYNLCYNKHRYMCIICVMMLLIISERYQEGEYLGGIGLLIVVLWEISIILISIPCSHHQCGRNCVPFSPQPGQYLLLSDSLMVAILSAIRWNLSVAVTCNSLKPRVVNISSYIVLVVCVSFSLQYLFISLAHFYMGILF